MILQRGDVVFFRPESKEYVEHYFTDIGPYLVVAITRAYYHTGSDRCTLQHLQGKKPYIDSFTPSTRLRKDDFLTAVHRAKTSGARRRKAKP